MITYVYREVAFVYNLSFCLFGLFCFKSSDFLTSNENQFYFLVFLRNIKISRKIKSEGEKLFNKNLKRVLQWY